MEGLYVSAEKLTIYCKPYCPNCTKAKEFCMQHYIPYVAIELDPDDDAYMNKRDILLTKSNGHKTFPFIFYSNMFVGGYSELVQAYPKLSFKDKSEVLELDDNF